MKTRSKICLIGALFFALMIAWNVCDVDIEVKESQSAGIQATEPDSPSGAAAIPNPIEEEYEKWLKSAENSAGVGSANNMEAYLTRAKWCVEDADIPEEVRAVMLKDISEKAEAIRMKGYREAASDELTNALSLAYGGHGSSMQGSLERYRIYCLKAGMEPDGRVKRIKEIFAATLDERKKLGE